MALSQMDLQGKVTGGDRQLNAALVLPLKASTVSIRNMPAPFCFNSALSPGSIDARIKLIEGK